MGAGMGAGMCISVGICMHVHERVVTLRGATLCCMYSQSMCVRVHVM